MVSIDADFPSLLGAQLYEPTAQYIMKHISRPQVIHEFLKGPGDTIQLDRYKYWDAGREITKTDRQRSETQTIGVANGRRLAKDKRIIVIEEYTGPASESDPTSPGTFQIPLKTILTAQRKLWEYGQRAFHDSIGSMRLLDDFRNWEDRVYINEFLKSTFTYNPDGIVDGGTYNLTSRSGEPPRFTVKDLEQVVADLATRNVPVFEDQNYCCVCSPYFLKDLRRDPDFMEVSRYVGAIPLTAMMGPSEPMHPPQLPFSSSNGGVVSMSTPWQGGLMAGQGRSAAWGQPIMPTGFVFDGVRFFVSTNLPKALVNLTYTNQAAGITGGAANRQGEIGIFFGPQAIGVGVGGVGPQVLLNSNTDFDRFVIAIWQMYGSFELLDERFVTIGRSYQN